MTKEEKSILGFFHPHTELPTWEQLKRASQTEYPLKLLRVKNTVSSFVKRASSAKYSPGSLPDCKS